MANVFFAKGDTNTINQIPIRDGQILFDLQAHIIYVDNGTIREPYAGSDTSSAEAISFNNTDTDLLSENVQDVINEINGKIITMQTNIDDFNTFIGRVNAYTNNLNINILASDISNINWEE